jgi:hypothetical protein
MPRKKLIRSFSISLENIGFIEKFGVTQRSKFVDEIITAKRKQHEDTEQDGDHRDKVSGERA